MSESKKEGSVEFSETWSRVSKLPFNNFNTCLKSDKHAQSPDTTTRAQKELETPKRKAHVQYTGLSNGDSPSDGEVLHDIIWDSTSPNQEKRQQNTRVFEISDIVRRIAPKDNKPAGLESPLLQWIGDSAVSSTPEFPQRVRKKSSRKGNVEDLMKLARQFDKNMQEDKVMSEQLSWVNNNLSYCRTSCGAEPAAGTETLVCLPSTSQQAEAELHALFDCSTQRVNWRLSQGSSAFGASQETIGQSATANCKQTYPQPAHHKASVAGPGPVKDKGSSDVSSVEYDEFDDDWDDDDLLHDAVVLAMTQNTQPYHDAFAKPVIDANANQCLSACKPAGSANSAAIQGPGLPSPQLSRAFQELYPKTKTGNRSTFKLEHNLNFQAKAAAANPAETLKLNVTAIRPPNCHISDQKPPATRHASSQTVTKPQPDKTPACVSVQNLGERLAPDSVTDIRNKDVASRFDSDSLWDNIEDDELLYQVCDTIERLSNNQPVQANPTNLQRQQDAVVNGAQLKITAPQHTVMNSRSSTPNRHAATRLCARSNSLPGTISETVSYKGWNIPLKGSNINQAQMSQSQPGGQGGLGMFSHVKDSSRSLHVKNDAQPCITAARINSKSHHATFKRNFSDSAAIGNKVFVTSHVTGKCSAAEIERKKQEALARRRMRMQSCQKP